MKAKVVMGTLVCFSVIGLQEVDIFAQYITKGEITSLSRVKSNELRKVIDDGVVVKKINSDVGVGVARLNKGDIVEVVRILDEWVEINLKGQIGYVKSKCLTKLETTEVVNYIDNVDKVEIYEEAKLESKKIGALSMFDKVKVIDELEDFIKISYNGNVGYIKNNKEILVDEIKRIVKSSTVFYKKSANGKYRNNGIIHENSVVTVLENEGEYLKISLDGKIGYVRKEKVEDRRYININTLTPEILREKASQSGDIKSYIAPNAKVSVIGYEGEYAKVTYGDYQGYIRKSSLSKNSEKINSENLINKYKISDKYKVEDIQDKIIDIIESEVLKYKKKSEYKSDEEIFSKYSAEILKTLEDKLVKTFNMSRIDKSDVIEGVFNYGVYLKIDIKGSSYYVENTGFDLKDRNKSSTKYIQTLHTYDTTVNTRYVNKMNCELYSMGEVDDISNFDISKSRFIGYLVKDSVVELVDDLKNGYSIVKVNGVKSIIKSSEISTEKTYTKVKQDVKSINTNKSHKNYVDRQIKKLNIVSKGGKMVEASYEDLAYYSNPNKLSVNKSKSKYQYLRLDQYRNINVYKLNEYLNNLHVPSGKKHIFKNKAEVFVNAAKKYNIDVLYLVSHMLLETGNGTSKLSQGIEYKKGVLVYNFFGIGAYDSSPIESGTKTAFNKGWTTIDKAIEGSAQWLSENYINNKSRQQNTLYKMRFNYMSNASHQYATDIGWGYKISVLMNKLSYMYEDTVLNFEVPKYKSGTYVSKQDKIKNANSKEEIIEDKGDGENSEVVGDNAIEDNKTEKPVKPSKPIKPVKPSIPEEDKTEDTEESINPIEPSVPEEDESQAPVMPEEPEDNVSDIPVMPEEPEEDMSENVSVNL